MKEDEITINGEVYVRKASIPPPPDRSSVPDVALPAKEAAEMINCTTRTLQRYGNLGIIRRIGGRKTGAQTRYSRNSVLAFLNGVA